MVKDVLGYHSNIKDNVEDSLMQAKKDLTTDDFDIIDKYSGDMMLDEQFEKQYCICYMKEIFTVIAADQKVYFCHQKAYRPDGLIGSIADCSFRKLWFSEETTKLFRKMNPKQECDFRCAFDERNILLEQLFDLDENHINFI